MYSIRVEHAIREGAACADAVSTRKGGETIEFSAGNPRVEHLVGRVHLFRECEERPSTAVVPRGSYPHDHFVPPVTSSSNRVCVLGLPPQMGFSELCTYLGDSYEHVTEIRLVRREKSDVDADGDGDGHIGAAHTASSTLLVLLSFDDTVSAETFYREFHDTPFCPLEPEFVCKLLFVKDVELLDVRCDTRPCDLDDSHDPVDHSKIELPSCPVCLDRLEPSASGIVTTVCNHRFHNQCLRQWVDSSCPVCRYVQGGECGLAGQDGGATSTSLECAHDSCHSTVDLWMCLICGHTGCGRYRGSHAAKHFEETGHGFALELADGRGETGGAGGAGVGRRRRSELVWDYMRDAYVHRVVDSYGALEVEKLKAGRKDGMEGDGDGDGDGIALDGDIVDRPARKKATAMWTGHDQVNSVDPALEQSKLDTVTTELTQLMVSQMEAQREYYQTVVESHHQATQKAIAESNAAASVAHAAAAAADAAAQRAEQIMRAVQRKNHDLVEKLDKSIKEQGFLRELNETLLSDTKGWRDRVAKVEGERDALRSEVSELNDQVKDLMMFIEARDAIEKGGFGAEAVGGSVGVVKKQTRRVSRR